MIGVIVLFMYACSDAKQNPINEIDCATFRTGKFVYSMEGDTTLYSAERDETSQKENQPGTANISTYKVNWISPCSYDLVLVEKYYAATDSSIPNNEGVQARINMLAIKGDSMIFEVRIPGVENGIRGSMKKIE